MRSKLQTSEKRWRRAATHGRDYEQQVARKRRGKKDEPAKGKRALLERIQKNAEAKELSAFAMHIKAIVNRRLSDRENKGKPSLERKEKSDRKRTNRSYGEETN